MPGLYELMIAFLLLSIVTLEMRRWCIVKPSVQNRPEVAGWWLPWLGNALQYGRNPYKFLESCRKKHGPVFTTLLAGREITFIVEPALISAMFRNSKDLDFGKLRAEVQESAFATSHEGSVHFAVEEEVYPNAFQHFTNTSMSSITSLYSRSVLDSLRSLTEKSPTSRIITLWDLVFPTIYKTSSKAMFGQSFPEDTLSNFAKFDEGFTLLASRIPAKFIGQYDLARTRLIAQLVKWTNTSISDADVAAETSRLVKDAVFTMKAADFHPSDVGGHLLSLLWGTQGNTIWTAFWFLAFILQNPPEVRRLRAAIEDTICKKFGGSLDAFVEADPDALNSKDFILLESGFREAMRLSSAVIIARQVSRDVVLKPKHGRPTQLVAGETIFVTPRNVHMSADIYDNPQTFQLDRFVADDGVSLRNFTMDGKLVPNNLLAWGGGPHMCKGRHIAVYQVKIFVALVLHLCDVEMSHLVSRATGTRISGRTLPKFDETCLGVMHTYEDLVCRIRT